MIFLLFFFLSVVNIDYCTDEKLILQTLNADVKFLPETIWSEMCLFSFPVGGSRTPRRQRVFMHPGTICWKWRTLGSSACYCELDSVSLPFSPLQAPSEWQTEQHMLKTPYRGRYKWRFSEIHQGFHLVSVSVTRDAAQRPTPRRKSVAERWPPTLFCSFLHCCPVKSWSECAVNRDKSGARRVSFSSNCLVFFLVFSLFEFFFFQRFSVLYLMGLF